MLNLKPLSELNPSISHVVKSAIDKPKDVTDKASTENECDHVHGTYVVKDNMPDLLSDVVKKKKCRIELPKLKAPTDHVRHGKTIIGLAWEMYIESFLDPTLALKNRDTTEGLT
ncbi:hypothetical protein Tco_1491934 [Tanacetum coccineum]